MSKYIVTVVDCIGVSNIQKKFTNEDDAKSYAATLALQPAFKHIDIGVYELKTTTVYEPAVTFKNV